MRLGERACYYYVVYNSGDAKDMPTDLMPRFTAYEYARMFDGTVHIHESAPRWRKWLWGGKHG